MKYKSTKKHLGSKDPWKQLEEQEQRIKKKKDFGPKDANIQEVPRKLRELFKPNKAKKHLEDLPRKRKKKVISSIDFMETQEKQKGMEKPLKAIPIFEQMPGENDRQFLNRSSLITQAYLKRSAFETKFDVDIYEDPESGNVDFVQRKKDEFGPAKQESKKKKKQDKSKAKLKESRKVERKTHTEQLKKDKEDNERFDFKHLKDTVSFGEVAKEPPTFKAKVRKAPVSTGENKPGRRDLLLKNLGSKNTGVATTTKPSSETMATLRRKEELEKERARVQHLYREMKKNKHSRT